MMPAFLIALSFLVSSEQPLQPTGKDRHAEPIRYAAFSPDSQSLATASMDGTVRVWSVTDCRLGRALTVEEGERKIPYDAVAFDNSGAKLAAFSRQPTSASLLAVWDVKTGKRVMQLKADYQNMNGGVSGMTFSPDNREVFCIATRYSYFWNLENQMSSTHFVVGHLAEGKAFYSQGRPLIVCGRDGVQFIDPITGKFVIQHRKKTLLWGDILNQGKFVALTFDGFIEIIDRRSAQVEKRFAPKHGKASFCVVTPDRSALVLMTDSGVIERWSLNDGSYAGRLEKSLRPPNAYATSISYGSGKPPMTYGDRHPTPLLVSKDGKTVCYVAGVQFAMMPAEWHTDE